MTSTVNPIYYARTSLGLSKMALSRKLEVSRIFIIRAEDGCYERPGGKLSNFACKELNIDRQTLQDRYERFQHYKRVAETEFRHPSKLGGDLNISTDSDHKQEAYSHEIFKSWRQDYWGSVTTFASRMCVHPASVGLYEDGKMSTMPQQLTAALQSMNLMDPKFRHNERWFYVDAA